LQQIFGFSCVYSCIYNIYLASFVI
jgi:hypothetical protein